jgi:hypothetical protein
MKLKDYIKKVWKNTCADKRTVELRDWLVTQDILDEDDYVITYDGEIHHTDDTFACEKCGDTHHMDDHRTVFSGRGGRRGCEESWCCSCEENYAFWCEHSENYFDSRFYTCVEVGYQSVCLEYNDDDLYYWHSSGEYRWDPEPEDEDEDNDGRSSYHGDRYTRNLWKTHDPFADLFGVELEIYASDKDCLSDICSAARDQGFIPESDGSLNDALGVEIVAPPLGLRTYRKGQWAVLLDGIRGKAIGWDAGTGYGIHISIRRSSLTRLQQVKFLRFFPVNRRFCEKVTGRASNGYANYDVVVPWTRDPITGRYAAAALRESDRIEVRAFRATLKKSSFLKNVQFVAALVEFVRAVSLRDITAECFCDFVTHPARRNRYRELVAFLNKKGLNSSGEAVS